ncbi:type II toxin-antitoxin system MqsA family antitoxin [Pseudomonas sp. O64]|uniref:type II toxin-antitoxin system MqsA family antitoxin n=1 Tax=unclassified Pseudomonas TaxID=196821 RepID=UPI00387AF48B
MNTQHCYICGAPDAMTRFEGRSETLCIKGMERRIDDLSGWECQVCEDGMYDPDSCERHAKAGDDLHHAARRMMGAELKRIRRKLHLTQKQTVELLSGGGHNAFSRYERGEIAPPKPLMVLMRLLDRYPYLLTDAKELAEGADLRNAFTYTLNNETQDALKAS